MSMSFLMTAGQMADILMVNISIASKIFYDFDMNL